MTEDRSEKRVFEIVVPIKKQPIYGKWCRNVFIKDFPRPWEQNTSMTLIVDPINIDCCTKIARLSLQVRNELKATSEEEFALRILTENRKEVVEIIAIGIQNGHKYQDFDMVDFIDNNFDSEILFDAYLKVMHQLHLESFMQCIVLLKGTLKITDSSGTETLGLNNNDSLPIENAVELAKYRVNVKH